MKVILKERVKSLGNVGDIVSVSQGYARNCLIPQKLAVIADEQNQRFIEDQQRRLAKKIKDQKNEALEMRKTIQGISIELTKRVAGNGKLFGAVTASEIMAELQKQNVETEKRWFDMASPIKELGTFDVVMKIFTDVEAKLKVKVLMDPKQAEELQKKAEVAKKEKAQEEAQEAKKEAKEEKEEKKKAKKAPAKK